MSPSSIIRTGYCLQSSVFLGYFSLLFFYAFFKFYFRVILGLQKSCKDSTESSPTLHPASLYVLPYITIVYLSKLKLTLVQNLTKYFILILSVFLLTSFFLFQDIIQDTTYFCPYAFLNFKIYSLL